jgi:hypothetical protein
VNVCGLSEVRFSYVPVQAWAPDPADKAAGVVLNPALTWRPGREAGSHQVFFGTDPAAVADGTAPAETAADHSFSPSPLIFGTAYYWKVDEVNTVSYPGDVWSFTTREYAVVDDFEGYTNEEGGRIYETWIDGWTNGSGSVVGYLQAPFAETSILHGGRQSMPFEYNNVKSPYYSEAERTFDSTQNWTISGADTLSLFYRGSTGTISNDPVPMYLRVEDRAGKSKTVVNANASATTVSVWTEWRIPLSDLSAAGVNVSAVKKIAIGVGDKASPKAGGAGRLYIDDIGFGHPIK